MVGTTVSLHSSQKTPKTLQNLATRFTINSRPVEPIAQRSGLTTQNHNRKLTILKPQIPDKFDSIRTNRGLACSLYLQPIDSSTRIGRGLYPCFFGFPSTKHPKLGRLVLTIDRVRAELGVFLPVFHLRPPL